MLRGLPPIEVRRRLPRLVVELARQPLDLFALGARLELHWLRDRIIDLPRATRWEAMARAALRDDVYSEQAGLTAEVLRAGTGVERWQTENASAIRVKLRGRSCCMKAAAGPLPSPLTPWQPRQRRS